MSASIALFTEQLWAHTKSGEPVVVLGVHVDDENMPQMLVVNGDGSMSWINVTEMTIDWRYLPGPAKWVDADDAPEAEILAEAAQTPAKTPARRVRKA